MLTDDGKSYKKYLLDEVVFSWNAKYINELLNRGADVTKVDVNKNT